MRSSHAHLQTSHRRPIPSPKLGQLEAKKGKSAIPRITARKEPPPTAEDRELLPQDRDELRNYLETYVRDRLSPKKQPETPVPRLIPESTVHIELFRRSLQSFCSLMTRQRPAPEAVVHYLVRKLQKSLQPRLPFMRRFGLLRRLLAQIIEEAHGAILSLTTDPRTHRLAREMLHGRFALKAWVGESARIRESAHKHGPEPARRRATRTVCILVCESRGETRPPKILRLYTMGEWKRSCRKQGSRRKKPRRSKEYRRYHPRQERRLQS